MRQILSDNVYILERNVFKDLQLFIIYENCNQTIDIIARLYHKYM